MQTINIKRLGLIFTIMVVLGLSIGFSSCKDEEGIEFNYLEGIGPIPATRGEKLNFVGANLSDVVAVVFANGVEVNNLEFDGNGKFSIVVPNEASAGKVTLKLKNGSTYTSVTTVSFKQTMIVESFEPAEVYPGEEVTIKGQYLTDGIYLSVNGEAFPLRYPINEFGDQDSIVVSASDTQITVKIPYNAQSGLIGLADDMNAALSQTPIKVTEPIFTSIASSDAKAVPGKSTITIKGEHLELVQNLEFSNGALYDQSIFDAASETEISFKLPADASFGVINMIAPSGKKIPTTSLDVVHLEILDQSIFNEVAFDKDGKNPAFVSDGKSILILDAANCHWSGDVITLDAENANMVDSVFICGKKCTIKKSASSVDITIPAGAGAFTSSNFAFADAEDITDCYKEGSLLMDVQIYTPSGIYGDGNSVCLKVYDISSNSEYDYASTGKLEFASAIADQVKEFKYAAVGPYGAYNKEAFTVSADNMSITFENQARYCCYDTVPLIINFKNNFSYTYTPKVKNIESISTPVVTKTPSTISVGSIVKFTGLNLDKVEQVKIGDKNIYQTVSAPDSKTLFVEITAEETKANGELLLSLLYNGTWYSYNKITIKK